jgi:5'(3')-deoxyribonucleotidase
MKQFQATIEAGVKGFLRGFAGSGRDDAIHGRFYRLLNIQVFNQNHADRLRTTYNVYITKIVPKIVRSCGCSLEIAVDELFIDFTGCSI